MNTGKVLLTFLAGIAAGAILGVLFAPDKGSETRKKITGKGEEYAEDLTKKFNEFLAGVKEKYSDAKEDDSETTVNAKAKTS